MDSMKLLYIVFLCRSYYDSFKDNNSFFRLNHCPTLWVFEVGVELT